MSMQNPPGTDLIRVLAVAIFSAYPASAYARQQFDIESEPSPTAAQLPVVHGPIGSALDDHMLALDSDGGGFCGVVLVARDDALWTLAGDRERFAPWPQDNDVWRADLTSLGL